MRHAVAERATRREFLGALAATPLTRDAAGLRVSDGTALESGGPANGGFVRMKVTGPSRRRYAWVSIPPPPKGWRLANRRYVEADIVNTGAASVDAALWVVGRRGWDAVPEFAQLAAGQSRRFRCDLRSAFPDGVPKIDPSQVRCVQIMLRSAEPGSAIEARRIEAEGQAPPWKRPPTRIDVPEPVESAAAPGRRVFFRTRDNPSGRVYACLFLPKNWTPSGRHPVIAEFPGNIFYAPECYSTGRPDQCVIGYGMSRGEGAIWVSLPFVDPLAASIAEDGWGDPAVTASYAVQVLDEICDRFAGDRDRIVLTGFSRGAIACGFIGLRDDRIARLWRGIHTCQHYDGDGWGGAALPGALERARRFAGRPMFHTDNPAPALERIMTEAGIPAVYAQSGLGFHSCAMFLDDRPSTLQLRRWFHDLKSGGHTAQTRGPARASAHVNQ